MGDPNNYTEQMNFNDIDEQQKETIDQIIDQINDNRELVENNKLNYVPLIQ